MSEEQLLQHLTGNAGKDAEVVETKVGKIVKFSIAVTMRYGDDPITRWVNVAVFDERRKDDQDDALSTWQKKILSTVEKGSKVAVEGILKSKKLDGKTVYDMSAKRVGLVDWIARDGKAYTGKKRAVEVDEDEEGEGPSGW